VKRVAVELLGGFEIIEIEFYADESQFWLLHRTILSLARLNLPKGQQFWDQPGFKIYWAHAPSSPGQQILG
jgi:hypothetical protein